MAKIQNISEIHPTLGFTEFDILEKYRSDSGFCAVRPVRLDRSVKAFVDFIGSSPAQKNKIFCFSEQEKNSLTGGTPHFVRQTPPVGRSETLTGSSFLLQWSSVIKPFISREHDLAKEELEKFYRIKYRLTSIGLWIVGLLYRKIFFR